MWPAASRSEPTAPSRTCLGLLGDAIRRDPGSLSALATLARGCAFLDFRQAMHRADALRIVEGAAERSWALDPFNFSSLSPHRTRAAIRIDGAADLKAAAEMIARFPSKADAQGSRALARLLLGRPRDTRLGARHFQTAAVHVDLGSYAEAIDWNRRIDAPRQPGLLTRCEHPSCARSAFNIRLPLHGTRGSSDAPICCFHDRGRALLMARMGGAADAELLMGAELQMPLFGLRKPENGRWRREACALSRSDLWDAGSRDDLAPSGSIRVHEGPKVAGSSYVRFCSLFRQ